MSFVKSWSFSSTFSTKKNVFCCFPTAAKVKWVTPEAPQTTTTSPTSKYCLQWKFKTDLGLRYILFPTERTLVERFCVLSTYHPLPIASKISSCIAHFINAILRDLIQQFFLWIKCICHLTPRTFALQTSAHPENSPGKPPWYLAAWSRQCWSCLHRLRPSWRSWWCWEICWRCPWMRPSTSGGSCRPHTPLQRRDSCRSWRYGRPSIMQSDSATGY